MVRLLVTPFVWVTRIYGLPQSPTRLYPATRSHLGGKGDPRWDGSVAAWSQDCMDLVITNALIVDYWGIVKADVGVKSGRLPPSVRRGTPTFSQQ